MALAEAEHCGEIVDANPSGKIFIDIRNQPSALPSQQTSGCYSSIYGGWLRRHRCRALLSLKKYDGTRDVRTGSFAVTLTRFVCSFDELGRDN